MPPLYQKSHVQMYYMYTTNNDIDLYTKYNLENLNILRFNLSEKKLLKFRLDQNKEINDNIIDLLEKRELKNLSKIAFISRDFHERRPSGQLTIKFFKLIKELFPDMKIYFYMHLNSPISDYFKSLAKVIANENLDLLKDQILKDEIDILIDMQGHMHSNFNNLFKYRLAPIQLHWLGYPGTLGIKTIDYLVADETIIPKESQPHYVEKMAYMPYCYQCNNDDLLVTTSNLKRSDFNIPDDAFAFCHFNHEYKLDRKTWFVWMSILKRVPNSVLVFTTFCPNFVKVLFHDANINGISKERLIYLDYETDREKHFNRINLCNLGLDCYKLNGHTSSSDLIASGIPLITYTSETYHNRVAKSILKAVDLEELVCYSFEEYANLAVRLATNKNYYNSVCKKVIENRKKYLFNTKLYVENFMNMLHTIWNNEKTKDEIEETPKEEEEEEKEEKEEKEENEEKEIINKDYNLPVFNIVFDDFDNPTFMFKVKKLLNYICNQNYLNIQLIIIINNKINIQNLAVLNEIIYFHNVYYYNDIPDDLINIITVDSNNFETITDDLFFVSNYYKNNKETINSDITNIISHESIDLSKLYNDKMEKLKNLTINSENFENLPHIYWINLERSHERREKTIEQLDQYKLKHTRIDACDYLSFDDFSANNIDEFYNYKIEETKKAQINALDEIRENNNPVIAALFTNNAEKTFTNKIKSIEKKKNHKKKELSCLSSHLKAIEQFLKTNDEYCIIAEDDISVEYTKYWNNTFWEWFEDLPDDWECVQLAQILTVQSIHNCNYLLDRINVMPYKSNFSWSCAAYMLNRKGAQKLLDNVKIFDNKYYFKNLNESIADVFVYKYLNTFTIPLFTYIMNYDSTINNNDKHLEISKKCIDKIWINYYESKTNSF